MEKELIEQTEQYVKGEMSSDATGHDWYHVDRVRKNALHIAKNEQDGDLFIIEMAALLHDIPDEKLNETAEKGREKLDQFLSILPINETAKSEIKQIIYSISFKGGNGSELTSIEAKIVQDADRLDAIGAIGIARAFAFGGKKGQPIYEPEFVVRNDMTLEEYRNGRSSSVNHFHEKLLKLKDLLNTKTASKMAEQRHETMELFLQHFYREWECQ